MELLITLVMLLDYSDFFYNLLDRSLVRNFCYNTFFEFFCTSKLMLIAAFVDLVRQVLVFRWAGSSMPYSSFKWEVFAFLLESYYRLPTEECRWCLDLDFRVFEVDVILLICYFVFLVV